jgi:hypothetical protein
MSIGKFADDAEREYVKQIAMQKQIVFGGRPRHIMSTGNQTRLASYMLKSKLRMSLYKKDEDTNSLSNSQM